MSEEQRRKGAHFTFNCKFNFEQKNTSLNFNSDTIKSIQEEKNMPNSKSNLVTSTTLPINLFHSPGQYNKMIINCSNKHKESYLQKQMGIIKTLDFINQPFFQKEKQKRIERLKNYQDQLSKQRREQKLKQSQKKFNCICCCCDNYCEDCAKITSCDMPRENIQRCRQQFQKQIQAIKRRVKEKQKIREKSQVMSRNSSEISRFKKQKNHNFHINMLVNQSLFKQIQAKRYKILEKLQKQQKHIANQQFNQTVRKINRQISQSANSKRYASKEPTKQEIRQAYWKQIKDLVAQQIKKDKIEHSKLIQDKNQKKQLKKTKTSKSLIAINRLILKRSEQTLRQMKQEKQKKQKLQKIRAKILFALAAEQSEIIKKNRSKKFIPTQEMLQNAFKLID